MALKTQYQIGLKQRRKRKVKRDKLTKKGMNLADYYYGKYYVKLGRDLG